MEWISVEEKTPKLLDDVLISNSIYGWVEIGYIDSIQGSNLVWMKSYCGSSEQVAVVVKPTHWMPLPEPPKKKGENDG